MAGARAGMDDHPRLFVNDGDMLVGKKNLERQVFRLKIFRRRDLHIRLYPIPRPQLIACFFEHAVDPDELFVDEPLELGAGEFPDPPGQKDIQPLSGSETGADQEFCFRHVDVS